jgi:diguanylate cyclase (GGDEF)-like protein
MMDLDKFKLVNDTYGHAAGDEVLKALVKTSSLALRKSDILARYGGEEFVVLLPHAHLAEAIMLAERLRKGISEIVIPYEEHTLKVTISIGVSTLAETESDVVAVLSRADQALYQAKANGRDRVETVPAPVA